MATTIVVADDQKIMRDGITALLRRYTKCEVIGQAEDGKQAVEMVARLKPDMVILDVSMPAMSGAEATKAMLVLEPELKILAVSAYMEAEVIETMIQAGVYGYIIKDSLFEDLQEGIKALQEGRKFFSQKIADKVPAGFT